MRWKRTEYEWELLLEELQDRLEAEEERRRTAEDTVDQLRGQVEGLRRALHTCAIPSPQG